VCGTDKAGAASFSAISIQGELGNHQAGALDVHNRTIHFSTVIREYTKSGNLGRQPSGVFFRIAWTHAQEYQESTLAGAYVFSVYRNARVGDPLNQGTH
jgi:hypothetical protein